MVNKNPFQLPLVKKMRQDGEKTFLQVQNDEDLCLPARSPHAEPLLACYSPTFCQLVTHSDQ